MNSQFFDNNSIRNTVMVKDDKAIEYIIFQNNELLTMNSQLKNELQESKTINTDLEEEVDSLTRSRTCLQGYVKNFNELSTLEECLKNNYKNIFTLLKNTMIIDYIIFCSLLMINVLIDIPYTDMVLLLTFYVIWIPYTYMNMKHIYFLNVGNVKIQKEIDQLKKGNDYVQELIDSM